MKRIRNTYFLFFLFLGSCQGIQGFLNSKFDVPEVASFNVNSYKLHNVVCDPFNRDQLPPSIRGGLRASLFYLGSGQTNYNNVSGYINNGIQSEKTLFFTELNVPTRMFYLGFPTETGTIVKDDLGKDLIEWFGLRFETQVKLGPNDEEGEYELALLSDDGALWLMNQNNDQWSTVVNNNGTHPTRLGCGKTIEMTRDTFIESQFLYYQGPRYHISMIPLWRKVDSATTSEPLCGSYGNSLFFDPENGSSQQAAYKNLLVRGWRPLTFENYKIPDINPCTEGIKPQISNFSAEYIGQGKIKASWLTDIPATSQLMYINLKDSKENLSDSDNLLRTSHEVVIGNLVRDETYVVQGISISSTFGKSLSEPKTVVIDDTPFY